MSQRLQRHLSFANVTSLMALVLAMGGTGYALTLPKNSVGSKQIRKNAVTTTKVKNRTLRARDFAIGQLPAGSRGAMGATGPAGAKGDPGVQGPPGVVGAVTVQRGASFDLADGANSGLSVPCLAGTRAIGGGSSIAPVTGDAYVTTSRPDRTGDIPQSGETFSGWRVAYRNPAGGPGEVTVSVFAVCAAG